MLPLETCPSCGGFVRQDARSCHHCRALRAPSRWSRLGKGLLGIAGGLSLATTLMACYGPPPMYNRPGPTTPSGAGCTDADGDGACVPNDCNDADPSVYPGAVDGAGDGTDQDCDGYDGPPATP